MSRISPDETMAVALGSTGSAAFPLLVHSLDQQGSVLAPKIKELCHLHYRPCGISLTSGIVVLSRRAKAM